MSDRDDDLLADLRSFSPTGDDYADVERLTRLMDDWVRQPPDQRASALPSIFAIFERNPDAMNMGMPGPIVHALETACDYELELAHSLERKPSFYALWMVNRMLNQRYRDDELKAVWIPRLLAVLKNPRASPTAKSTAAHLLEEQWVAVPVRAHGFPSFIVWGLLVAAICLTGLAISLLGRPLLATPLWWTLLISSFLGLLWVLTLLIASNSRSRS